ncbi:uncharacterized protein LOC109820162 [Asparagus officinalis]|uniref:uncharacterized protein LOC109820162 n=1 Tax=Asparagus officinalis TaxID=4686 RepID=UPI00098E383F|nr:uncharacterized protein LOC109820162 [Asparagus officinalis]
MYHFNEIEHIPDAWNLDITSCQEIESVDVPQQRGSLDCGEFLMAYMFSLVSGQPILIDQKDCARHRARIIALDIELVSLLYFYLKDINVILKTNSPDARC